MVGQAGSIDSNLAATPTPRGHMPALDGVRGLAILMVLIVHFVGTIEPASTIEKIVKHLADYGGMGVDLFFVLSGFLITGILVDSRTRPAYFRNFYMRRVLRIFPLYYGVLVLGLLIVPRLVTIPGMDIAIRNQAWLWGYAANILAAITNSWESLPMFSHFWSLAIEEHFYMAWPLVVYLCSNTNLKRAALLVATTALGLRLVLAACHANTLAIYALTPARLDAIALGSYMAVAARDEGGFSRLVRIAPRTLLVSSIFIVVTFIITRIFPSGRELMHQVRQSGFALCFSAILILALAGPQSLRRFFTSKAMSFLGKYSYGLYVFHWFLGYHMMRFHSIDIVAGWVGSRILAILVQSVVAIGISIAVALVSYHGYEKHFLKLKIKF
jgi:peptidoglycan/LPS O-acetylase OafA/YrhL